MRVGDKEEKLKSNVSLVPIFSTEVFWRQAITLVSSCVLPPARRLAFTGERETRVSSRPFSPHRLPWAQVYSERDTFGYEAGLKSLTSAHAAMNIPST